ncbi:MAG: hypothetical protein H6620_11325 [Halobacteriovoraceae bacterium]|nr:hypothetical protein [Halobacteriovoraceae bacterium]
MEQATHYFVKDVTRKSGGYTSFVFLVFFVLVFLGNSFYTLNLNTVATFYILSLLTSSLQFEKSWRKGISTLLKTRQWKVSLVKDKNFFIIHFNIFADSLIEVMLVVLALDLNLSPASIFLALAAGKIVGAPIQGYICDHWRRKYVLIFSLISSLLLAFTVQNEGLSDQAFFVILTLKGLLGNTAPICRAILADSRLISRT